MRFRIPQFWLYDFARRLLMEADVDEEAIDADLKAMVYESGERGWDEDEDDDYFFIDWDDD